MRYQGPPIHFEDVYTPRVVFGVWVAYHEDWTSFRLHDNEETCLRFAVTHDMCVKWVPFDEDPRRWEA